MMMNINYLFKMQIFDSDIEVWNNLVLFLWLRFWMGVYVRKGKYRWGWQISCQNRVKSSAGGYSGITRQCDTPWLRTPDTKRGLEYIRRYHVLQARTRYLLSTTCTHNHIYIFTTPNWSSVHVKYRDIY